MPPTTEQLKDLLAMGDAGYSGAWDHLGKMAPTLAAEVVRLRLHLSRMLMAQDGVPINAIEFGRWVDEARKALDATSAT